MDAILPITAAAGTGNTLLMITAAEMAAFAENVVRSTLEKVEQERKETFMTPTQVGKYLGVSATTLWRWKQENYLVPHKMGSKTMYCQSDVERIKGVR